jgi:carbonic anhydrase
VLRHPQAPWSAKAILWLAIGYLLMPFDLIPDFIPILGQLDELVILPALVYLALRLTPDAIVAECRVALENIDKHENGKPDND